MLAREHEQETAFVGGGFDAVYLPKAGPQIWIDPPDITTAYAALWEIDCALSMLLPFVMSLGPPEEIQHGSQALRDYIAGIANDLSQLKLFPSLVSKMEKIK